MSIQQSSLVCNLPPLTEARCSLVILGKQFQIANVVYNVFALQSLWNSGDFQCLCLGSVEQSIVEQIPRLESHLSRYWLLMQRKIMKQSLVGCV